MARRPESSIEEIIRGAASGDAVRESAAPTTEEYRELADKVELLLADLSRLSAYPAASADYVTAFTDEMRWHKTIRAWVAIACAVIILVLLATLGLAIYNRVLWFGRRESHALTALIVATISGTVVIAIAVAKAVFAPISERNAGLPMPEHIKTLWEAMQSITGNK